MMNSDDLQDELTEEIEEAIDTAEAENKFRRFDKFRKLAYEDEDDIGLWNDELDFITNLTNICNRSFLFPHRNIQLPIFLAYSLIPSAMANICPVMFFNGGKGSGKSTAMQLVAAIHRQELLSALSTGAALRNHINKSRWYDPVTCDGEKNTCLLFDNVSRETLKDDFLYSLFLNGYNRKTDKIIIADKAGKNLEFRVFAPKIISSIHPLLNQPELDELQRRCMTLKFKNWDKMTEGEREGSELNSFAMLDLEAMNLSVIGQNYYDFWNDETMTAYATHKKSIKAYARKMKNELDISSHRWTIAQDILATGLVFNIWGSPQAALKSLQHYWNWHDRNIAHTIPPLHSLLMDIIASEIERVDTINSKYQTEVMVYEIDPKLIKDRITQAVADGELDTTATATGINIAMNHCGWELKKNGLKRMKWQPIK